MLTLYDSKSGTFIPQSGAQDSDTDLRLNILIELRVLNAILLALQQGVVTDSLAQLRADAVSDSPNPST